MIKEILCCDQCNKESKDIHGDIDWIKFKSESSIKFSTKRGKVSKGYGPEIKELVFCSTHCMLEWMELSKIDEEKEQVIKNINELITKKCLSREEEATYEVTINTTPEKTKITSIKMIR